ncbi:MAG: ornithine carbamoyltransferase [Candidatus Eisenbacteria bacterium]|nr:ornithine carbamoyltransferase [Candidatus Eisenbacteria bacterium]
MMKDFISIADVDRTTMAGLFDLAAGLKRDRTGSNDLAGKTVGLLFHKPSLRTRVSFEVGVSELGGHPMYVTDAEIKMGQRESTYDIGKVLSRYVHGIMIRTFAHSNCTELAAAADIPVINGLTDLTHPCQVMGDILTCKERGKDLDSMVVAFIGDGNNVANSWVNAAGNLPFELRISGPSGYEPDESLLQAARAKGARVSVLHDPIEAVTGADVVYTDVWTSMGQEDEKAERDAQFRPFQVNDELLSHASSDAIVLHCLPAHRGEEITDAVMDGPRSAVFDQAENRLHIQKAVMVELMGSK